VPGPGEVVDQHRSLDAKALDEGASVPELLLGGTVRREMLARVRFPGVEEDGADPARRVIPR
jgi:hypothetical protein